MIRKLLILIFVSFTLNFSAQKYRPFDSTTVWRSIYNGQLCANSCYRANLLSYHMKGYVIIANKIWNKLYLNSTDGACYCFGSTTPGSNIQTQQFHGFIHNDTLNKRVYYSATQPSTLAPVNILFDFNKIVGDTFKITGNPCDLKYHVSYIDSILFSSKFHKRFVCNKFYPCDIWSMLPDTAYFIEGIGSSFGTFDNSFYLGVSDETNQLQCFSSPSDSKYFVRDGFGSPTSIQYTATCNTILIGIKKNLQDEDLNFYPNPIENKVTFNQSNSASLKNLKIIDLIGEIKYFKNELMFKERIDLSFLTAGIYFISIDVDSITHLYKILKE